MNVYQKIKLIETKSGLTTAEFCKSIGIPYVTYNNYVRGKREMPLSKVIQMCIMYNINCNWLLKDEGEMFEQRIRDISDIEKAEELLNRFIKRHRQED